MSDWGVRLGEFDWGPTRGIRIKQSEYELAIELTIGLTNDVTIEATNELTFELNPDLCDQLGYAD